MLVDPANCARDDFKTFISSAIFRKTRRTQRHAVLIGAMCAHHYARRSDAETDVCHSGLEGRTSQSLIERALLRWEGDHDRPAPAGRTAPDRGSTAARDWPLYNWRWVRTDQAETSGREGGRVAVANAAGVEP